MNVLDIAVIVIIILVSGAVCIREYRKNKGEAKKTKKHLILEFFNHFGDTWNYRR